MGSAPAKVWALHKKLPRSLPGLPKSGPSIRLLWMGTWRQFLPEGRSQVCTQCPQAWILGLRVGPCCRVHTCQPATIRHLLGAPRVSASLPGLSTTAQSLTWGTRCAPGPGDCCSWNTRFSLQSLWDSSPRRQQQRAPGRTAGARRKSTWAAMGGAHLSPVCSTLRAPAGPVYAGNCTGQSSNLWHYFSEYPLSLFLTNT